MSVTYREVLPCYMINKQVTSMLPKGLLVCLYCMTIQT